MELSGNTILITGGGSGIGEALAHRFHDSGNVVVIAGRRAAALDRACTGRANMHSIVFDVSDAAGTGAFARQVLERFPDLTVLVNNAGIMRLEAIGASRDLGDARSTIETNLLGPIRLIDALVDHLATRPASAIINVTSGLAFVPLVTAASYSASKAAMHSYTVSLRKALAGRVEVIELAPPAVQTTLTPGQESREGYQPLDDFADEVMALFAQSPTPHEILVRNVLPLRHAEAEGNFQQRLDGLNG